MEKTVLPDLFLISKVITLWKNKWQISDISTHRGITLGNIPIKIMEAVIMMRINEHLERFGLIDSWQHGFQKKRSTIINLVNTWEFLSSQINANQSWVSLSVDFSNAFDRISISHLLLALQKRGIRGQLGKFLEYWMKNRKQIVQVGEQLSTPGACTSGVGQGSIGGPIFFCILLSEVINNLPTDGTEKVCLKIWCFADDTHFIFRSRNHQESSIAQEFIDSFITASAEVGLQVNAKKSVVVYYGNHNYVTPIIIDGSVVPVENESLELGCVFTNKMNFKPQLERNVKKANSFIYTIRSVMKVRNHHVLEKFYYTYYCPILLYASQVWLTDHVYMQDTLYAMHRKFWRLGNGYISPKPYILDTYQLALKHSLTFLFQMKMGHNCLEFNDFFTEKKGEATRSHSNKELVIQRNRTVNRDAFFTTFIAKEFNMLPLTMRQAKSVNIFKNQLRDHLKMTIPTPNFNYTPWYKR